MTEWMKQYSNWMKIPGEINNDISSIFFDYEIAFGEQKIEDAITDIIFVNTRKNKLFFDYLGNDANIVMVNDDPFYPYPSQGLLENKNYWAYPHEKNISTISPSIITSMAYRKEPLTESRDINHSILIY
jgi:hypothetical protein